MDEHIQRLRRETDISLERYLEEEKRRGNIYTLCFIHKHSKAYLDGLVNLNHFASKDMHGDYTDLGIDVRLTFLDYNFKAVGHDSEVSYDPDSELFKQLVDRANIRYTLEQKEWAIYGPEFIVNYQGKLHYWFCFSRMIIRHLSDLGGPGALIGKTKILRPALLRHSRYQLYTIRICDR